jgi:glutamate-5-semialdehyde dehydrogenase
MTLDQIFQAAKQASKQLAQLNTEQKNQALESIAVALERNTAAIVEANRLDLLLARETGLAAGLVDRLTLSALRIESLTEAIRDVIKLPDPIGASSIGKNLPNGLALQQVRVPFGLVGVIYEARPNVTVDIAALALKSGNAVLLRGGSAAENTNLALVATMQATLESQNLPIASIQTVDAFGRDGAVALMRARGVVDVLIPRGSASLIKTVVEESTVPVIETGDGVVHMFLDETADTQMSIDLVNNSKTQRVSVCNALETLLVHEKAAARLLPAIAKNLEAAGVTIHGCSLTLELVPNAIEATEADWSTEYYSLDLSVKVVGDLSEALEHIERYSTHHTESIVTNDLQNAERFLSEVDSAVVMVNASTRFTDGGEFGFGAEVGISTQKLHARGPMGLPELTSSKWLIRGAGQVRK